MGFITILIFLGVFLYQFAGLKYYLRAANYINDLPKVEDRNKAWSDFVGVVSTDFYSGLYAGNFFDRVWVWGKTGLRSFKTTSYSTYTYFDGCTDKFLHPEKYNWELPVLGKDVTFKKSQWLGKVRLGDLVVVTIGKNEIKGSLKEIYTYNYWPFLYTDQKIQCAK